ncbi:MAG: hypothetical protein M1527_04785 [Gammaproteobacteria bacterium]|nr:hypothetical protein [Gammaproteobacteria bacterium]
MPTATIYRDGRAIRTTTLTADDAEKFVILAAAVRDAQNIMRNKPEMDANGDALKTGTTDTGVYSESQPDDIYAVLLRLPDLLGKHARAVYPHINEAVNGDVLRNPDGSPVHGLLLAHKNTPVPAPYHVAAALAGQASTLGMIPLDGLAFEKTELTIPAVPAITESGGAKVGGVPERLLASVRWR